LFKQLKTISIMAVFVLTACNSTQVSTATARRQAANQSPITNTINVTQTVQASNTPELITSTPIENTQAVESQTPDATSFVTATAMEDITATLDVNPSYYAGLCNLPVVITFNGSITSSTQGTVTYHFIRSDGYSEKPNTLVFTGAGTQFISTSYTKIGVPNQPSSLWVELILDSPYNQTLSKAISLLNCSQGERARPTPHR
jgi:hypothetical protein